MIRHQTAMVALFLLLAVGGYLWQRPPALPDRESAMPDLSCAERAALLQQHADARRRFSVFCEEVVDDLAARRTSLVEARERLLFYCLRQHPDYLEFVNAAEAGNGLREKVARNLLRALGEIDLLPPPQRAERLRRLKECEGELGETLRAERT